MFGSRSCKLFILLSERGINSISRVAFRYQRGHTFELSSMPICFVHLIMSTQQKQLSSPDVLVPSYHTPKNPPIKISNQTYDGIDCRHSACIFTRIIHGQSSVSSETQVVIKTVVLISTTHNLCRLFPCQDRFIGFVILAVRSPCPLCLQIRR